MTNINEEQTSKISRLRVDDYKFDEATNPFAFDAREKRDLDSIARAIDVEVLRRFADQAILVRGVQSGKKRAVLSREDYLAKILETGTDKIFSKSDDDRSFLGESKADFHAGAYASFSKDDTVGEIFNLHIYKPGCDDRPQLPIDIFLIYDADDYDVVEYLHQRHKVLVRDAYKLKTGRDRAASLIGVIVIN